MCFLILPEALVSRENQMICKLCGCLCLRVHSGACMKAGSLEPLWCSHTFIYLLYSRGDGDGGSPDSVPILIFSRTEKKKKKAHERDSVEQ